MHGWKLSFLFTCCLTVSPVFTITVFHTVVLLSTLSHDCGLCFLLFILWRPNIKLFLLKYISLSNLCPIFFFIIWGECTFLLSLKQQLITWLPSICYGPHVTLSYTSLQDLSFQRPLYSCYSSICFTNFHWFHNLIKRTYLT